MKKMHYIHKIKSNRIKLNFISIQKIDYNLIVFDYNLIVLIIVPYRYHRSSYVRINHIDSEKTDVQILQTNRERAPLAVQ